MFCVVEFHRYLNLQSLFLLTNIPLISSSLLWLANKLVPLFKLYVSSEKTLPECYSPPHGLDCRSEHKCSSNTLSLVLIWNLKNVQFLKCICAHFRLDGKQEVITLIVLKPSRYPQVSKDVQCIGLFTVVVRCLHTFIMGLNVYATDILL